MQESRRWSSGFPPPPSCSRRALLRRASLSAGLAAVAGQPRSDASTPGTDLISLLYIVVNSYKVCLFVSICYCAMIFCGSVELEICV